MISPLQLLKEQLKSARDTFDSTAADIKPEDLHTDPGKKALTIAATYAHLIFSEDEIIHRMLQKTVPLYKSSWKDKTGASEPMPEMDANWEANHEKWSKTVQIDWEQIQKYTKAVYEETDKYINSIKDEDLEKEVDLGDWGKKTVAHLLYSFIIGHTNNLAGELSALKGVLGSKGYPF